MIEAYLFSDIDGKWALRAVGKPLPFAIVANESLAREMERLWNDHQKTLIERKINLEHLERTPAR